MHKRAQLKCDGLRAVEKPPAQHRRVLPVQKRGLAFDDDAVRLEPPDRQPLFQPEFDQMAVIGISVFRCDLPHAELQRPPVGKP
jgi:hypothetical protein